MSASTIIAQSDDRRRRSPGPAIRTATLAPAMEASLANLGDGGSARRLHRYPGNKGGAGVFQTIINQIPPHECFIEAFAGSGQILRHLRPARSRIVIDSDPAVIAAWQDTAGITAICADAVPWLADHAGRLGAGTVVYCDPPYLRSVRSSKRLYAHEFDREDQHCALLGVLARLAVPVLVSGYPSPLYARLLADWRRIDYAVMSHGGPRVECLWCNFPEPFALHDYRYLGRNFREREQIKRMKTRWMRRLMAMPRLRRLAILDTISTLSDSAGVKPVGSGPPARPAGDDPPQPST